MKTDELYMVISGCIAGDRRHQEVLYKTYYKSMMSLVKRYIECPFIAQEVLNDGFLTIFKKIDKYTYKGSFEGWMRKIMFHAVANAVKSDKRITTFAKRSKGIFKERTLEAKIDKTDGYEIMVCEPASYDNNRLEYRDMINAIGKLPRVTAKVFRLYIDGYKHNEIAEILKMSEGTSKWHVNQARTFIKTIITL